jgi:hypothetical protein
MTPAQQIRNVTGGSDNMGAVLLLTDSDVQMMVENPEQVMEEIQVRATQVSSVLEGILLEQHGQSHWGINE